MSSRWPLVPLMDLTHKVGSGSTPKGGKDSYHQSGIPLIRSMNVVFFGFKRNGLAFLDEKQAAQLANVEVRAGDVLLNITGASIGRVTVAPDDMDGARVNQHVCIIRTNEALDNRFLTGFLSSPDMQYLIGSENYGVTRQALTKAQILDFKIPLPPVEEQKRIADKFHNLERRVGDCRIRLDRVPAILKRFREAVLEAAVSGKLTEEWRGTASLTTWKLERAENVCQKVQSGGTPKEGFIDKPGIPFLKVYNLVDQKIDFDYRPQYVSKEVHNGPLAKSKAKPGDVLMNIVGPPLGKVAIVGADYPEWNANQALTLFRPGPEISAQWLYFVLCSGLNVREIFHETRGTVGQVNISLTQCRGFQFPIPPVAEQTEAVRRIEELFELASHIERQHTAAAALVTNLSSSILSKAFRGELVPPDPNGEPATVLLERIRQGREEQEAATKRKKKQTTASMSVASLPAEYKKGVRRKAQTVVARSGQRPKARKQSA